MQLACIYNSSTLCILVFLFFRDFYLRHRSLVLVCNWILGAAMTPFCERQLHSVRSNIFSLMDVYEPNEWTGNVAARMVLNCAFTLEPRIKALQLLITTVPAIYGYFTGAGRFATRIQQVRDISLQLAAAAIPLLLNARFYAGAIRSLRRASSVQRRQETAKLLSSTQKQGGASGSSLPVPVSPYPRVQ